MFQTEVISLRINGGGGVVPHFQPARQQGRAEGGEGGVNSRGPGILGARQIYLQKKIYTKKKFKISK